MGGLKGQGMGWKDEVKGPELLLLQRGGGIYISRKATSSRWPRNALGIRLKSI